jgi:hypothetical protein
MKNVKLKQDQIAELTPDYGKCIASDKITVDGSHIRYMYRDPPYFENDSGWRFFSGTETQAYINQPEHTAIYDVNVISNYDQTIIPYLNLPIGTELERRPNSDHFTIVS